MGIEVFPGMPTPAEIQTMNNRISALEATGNAALQVIKINTVTDANGYSFPAHGLTAAQLQRLAGVQAIAKVGTIHAALNFQGVNLTNQPNQITLSPGPAGVAASSPVEVTIWLHPTANTNW